MLHINLHILYILFIKLNFNLKEFKYPTITSKLSQKQDEILNELYINLN